MTHASGHITFTWICHSVPRQPCSSAAIAAAQPGPSWRTVSSLLTVRIRHCSVQLRESGFDRTRGAVVAVVACAELKRAPQRARPASHLHNNVSHLHAIACQCSHPQHGTCSGAHHATCAHATCHHACVHAGRCMEAIRGTTWRPRTTTMVS